MLAALYLPPLQTLLRTDGLGGGDLVAVLIAACGPSAVAQLLVARRRKVTKSLEALEEP